MGIGSLRGAARAGWACAVALALTVITGADVSAQENKSTVTQYGFRGGLSIDPDQFVAGAFMGFRDFSPGFSLRPSLDVGLGNSVFTFLVNGNGQYHFRNVDFAAVPYAGGGIALAYYNFDSAVDSETKIGANLFGGLEWDLGGYRHAFVEMLVGLGDLPDIKFVGGFGFL
ncbi:MAG: hypothetical protein ACRDGR_02765 [bacterium]